MTRFILQSHRADLNLRHAFTIARGTKSVVENVVVQLYADGHTGWGEAAPNLRYHEDAGKVETFFDQLAPNGVLLLDTGQELEQKIRSTAGYVASGAAAVEMAWWDWVGKSRSEPIWRLWGLPDIGPVSSFTIGLDEPEIIQKKVLEADRYPVLKVKLGGKNDREMIRTIRRVTDKPVRVDANEGWTSLEEASGMLDWLAGKNIELVEQPMPSFLNREMARLKKRTSIPLIADESFLSEESLADLQHGFHGINIKLMKIGGLSKAREKMKEARELGLRIMIGCMIETSLANTAGAILGVEADYVDLDGHLLIDSDPYEGLTLNEEYRICLPDRPGLGVIRRK
ncbi:MAG: dipeptide epimerase [Balneolaceae bacterium]